MSYNDGLQDIPGVVLPAPPDKDWAYFDVYQNYVIEVPDRDALCRHLRKEGVEVLAYWSKPLHKQPDLMLRSFALPHTESISKRVLSLPMYHTLTNHEVEYIVSRVRAHYRSCDTINT